MQYLLVDEGTCTESTVHEVKTQKIHVQPFQVITVRERTRCYHNGNTALTQGECGVAVGKIHVAVRAQPCSYWLT